MLSKDSVFLQSIKKICKNDDDTKELLQIIYEKLLNLNSTKFELLEQQFNINAIRSYCYMIAWKEAKSNRGLLRKNKLSHIELDSNLENLSDDNYDECYNFVDNVDDIFQKQDKQTREITSWRKSIRKQYNMEINILVHCNYNKPNGVSYHRLIIPHLALTQSHPNIKIFFLKDSGIIKTEYLKEKNIQIIVFSRNLFILNHVEKIKEWQSLGIKVVIDNDDYWELHNEHFLKEIYDKADKHVIQDNIKHADALICTNNELKYHIEKLTEKPIYILPNALWLKDEQWTPNKATHPTKVTIGYVAGSTHLPDINRIHQAFKLLNRDKELTGKYRLLLGGYRNQDKIYDKMIQIMTTDLPKQVIGETLVILPASDVLKYASMYNLMDVAIAPLLDREFNRCKSELKGIEAGTMQCSLIAQNMRPYNYLEGYVKLCDTPQQWYEAMRHYILNREEAIADGLKLKEFINTYYNLSVINQVRADIYTSLIN